MDELDAPRRTHMANERTFLAWWRTGLAAVAVSLGIGKIAPDLANSEHRWPYVAVGIAFAGLAVLVFWYGFARQRAVDEALRRGGYAELNFTVLVVMSAAAVVLSVATALVLAFD